MKKISRREAIKRTSLILGAAAAAPAVSAVLSGCQAPPAEGWQPEALSPEQVRLVEEITERILPATDTPGAKDAGVVRFVDSMLAGYFEEKDKTTLLEGLAAVENDARQAHGKSFVELSPEEMDAILARHDQAAFEARQNPERNPREEPFFYLMKSVTLLGFFTSEVGATEVLNYDPVPGNYDGCIPLESVGGKTWAT